MTNPPPGPTNRREFLRWLAGSPLFAYLAGCEPQDTPDQLEAELTPRSLDDLISSPDEALDVFDLEKVARNTLPPAHWGYMETGVDGEATRRNNRAGLERLHVRPRRLVDVSGLDTRTTLFGREWPTPIILAPVSSQRAFNAEGELATARAARKHEHLQVLSSVTSIGVEDVNEARGEPVWYQLYATSKWEVTQAVVSRVEAAGCSVLVLTVDLPIDSNRLTQERWVRLDNRDCTSCHRSGGQAPPVKPMYRGTSLDPDVDFRTPAMTWDFIDRLRDITDMQIVVKGLVTAEDAALALGKGVDGVWVSNHGGRAEGSGQATIDALPEIADVVGGRLPVIVDSGFRRGPDLFKGLARGADAVAIGRPYVWGLGAFGQAGVERVLQILQGELGMTMQLCGTPTLADIDSSCIGGD